MRWFFLGSVLGAVGMLYFLAALLPASREDAAGTWTEGHSNLTFRDLPIVRVNWEALADDSESWTGPIT